MPVEESVLVALLLMVAYVLSLVVVVLAGPGARRRRGLEVLDDVEPAPRDTGAGA